VIGHGKVGSGCMWVIVITRTRCLTTRQTEVEMVQSSGWTHFQDTFKRMPTVATM
jgi:hypothetical protein